MAKPPATRIDGHALSVLRQKDGHSLASLSGVTGIGKGYLHDLENGRRKGNAAIIKRLATALNIPMSMLEARQDAA